LGRSNPRKRVSPGRERYGQGWTMKGSATIRAFINRRHTAALHSPLSETNIKMPLAMEFQHHPSPHLTRVDAFRRHVNWKYNLVLSSYDELHKWSTDDVTSLNRELWHFCGVIYSRAPSGVIDSNNVSLWLRPDWFPGARLNFTENVLATGLAALPDKVAISVCREAGTQWTYLTWKQLEKEVARYASALKRADIRAGDRVASKSTTSIHHP
jgi:acetoacetyl-CoA synthetase